MKLNYKSKKLRKGFETNEMVLISRSWHSQKKQIFEKYKKAEYCDRKDFVLKMELTFSEITEKTDRKYISASSTGYTRS